MPAPAQRLPAAIAAASAVPGPPSAPDPLADAIANHAARSAPDVAATPHAPATALPLGRVTAMQSAPVSAPVTPPPAPKAPEASTHDDRRRASDTPPREGPRAPLTHLPRWLPGVSKPFSTVRTDPGIDIPAAAPSAAAPSDKPLGDTSEEIALVQPGNPSGPSATTPAQTVRQIAHQLMAPMPVPADTAVEVALNPEELGKVQMRVTPQDGAIIVSITVERPETLDLMRRHIDQLAQEYRQMGYDTASFSFRQGGSDDGSQHGEGGAEHLSGTATPETPETAQQPPARQATAGGIDIRI
ncbi:MAG: flagellar hook-length control protein FliK [Rhodobacteraceae bacterium]|nr:flagellar hook-length control protein FliK [Paracoccaceae bacterium]